MADKTSTLVLTINLSCCRCYKKIKKILSKFEEIQSVVFDEKQNKVTISGRFDPEKLKMKLRCKARNCLRGCDFEIVEEKKKPATPDKEDSSKEKKSPPPTPPPPLVVTVNVIGIPFPPYVPKVCQCQRPCYTEICKDGICPLPCEPKDCPKRCHGGCEKDEICSCSSYGCGSICSSPSFW